MHPFETTAGPRRHQELRRSVVGLAALAALVVGVDRAEAQANKLGFRVGEKSKLHTGLDVSALYDSNIRRREDDPNTAAIDESANADDVRLIFRPSLKLEVPGRSVAFGLGLGATISQFLGTSAANPDTQFGFDGSVYFRLGSNKSVVSFVLENTPMLTPTILPELGTIGADEVLFPAFTDAGRAYLTLRPGGGALEFDVGYENMFVIFDRGQGVGSPDDGFTHKAFIESRLKFLPKTALIFYADFGAFDPANPNRNANTLGANPFTAQIGLIGQITRSLSAEVRAGYAETLVWALDGAGEPDRFGSTAPTNQRTVVGLASLTWQIISTAQLAATYQRDLQPTVALSSFITDAFRLRANWSIDRLVLGAYAEAQLRDFGFQVDLAAPGQMPTSDIEREPFATLVFGGAKAEYYFLDWLVGGLNYRVMLQSSNDEERARNDGSVLPALGGFTRHQMFATVGARY